MACGTVTTNRISIAIRSLMRKKKKLPDNFAQLLEAGDLDAVKAVFETHEIDAKGGPLKEPAIRWSRLPAELVRWLVANGADVHAVDDRGRSVLDDHAGMWSGSHVALLIELGADPLRVGKYGQDALYHACYTKNVEAATALLAAGANPNAEYEMGETPLKIAVARTNNGDLGRAAPFVELLLAAGAKRTPEMKNAVRELGKTFEFFRADMNPDFVDGCEAGLKRLYELFDVEPVARRVIHDGSAPIEVKSTTWQKQHGELWQLLVPGQGRCKTVQGEVIRLSGRLSREILDNGGINWDEGWEQMARALGTYTSMGTPLSPSQRVERDAILEDIVDRSKTELYRLTELSVTWVLANRQPIALGPVDYHR